MTGSPIAAGPRLAGEVPGLSGATASSAPTGSQGPNVEAVGANVVSWERSRFRQTLPRVVSRCMGYSASPTFDEALVAAVSRFYGIDVDVATAETEVLEDDFERVRFFPWFLWDFPLPVQRGTSDGGLPYVTVGTRFLAEAELTDFERRVARALVASALAFVEIEAVDTARGELEVLDLRTGDRLRVHDPGLAAELVAGHIALVRLVRLADGDPEREVSGRRAPIAAEGETSTTAAVDAIYAVLPHETRPLVEMELERIVGREREPLAVLKSQAPELLDFAEHVLATLTEPPALLNADREPLLLCHTVLGGPLAERLEALIAGGHGEFVPTAAGEGLFEWPDLMLVRFTADKRRPGARAAVVMTNSRERFDRAATVLARLGVELPHLRSECELEPAARTWLARGDDEGWRQDPEIARAFESELSRWLGRWPDEPHPAVGDKTPRELLGQPDRLEVLGRLVERVRRLVGARANVLDAWLEASRVASDASR